MYKVNASIDWLTLSRTDDNWENIISRYASHGVRTVLWQAKASLGLQEVALTPARRQRFYDFGFEHEKSGLQVLVSNRTGTQGVKVQFSGAACSEHNVNPQFVAAASYEGWEVTRLDFAADVYARDYNAQQQHRVWKASGHKRFRSHAVYESESGSTFYLGSRRSDIFVRIYDKGYGTFSTPRTRFEIEIKGNVARHVGRQMDSHLYPAARLLRDAVAWTDCDLLLDYLDTVSPAEVPVRRRESTDDGRKMWLYSQVAPALAKMWQLDASDFVDYIEYVDHLRKDLADEEVW
jgi:DNA relaxase NicK